MSSSTIEALSEDNQARMATILESCLFALEHGEQLSPEELLQAHPDLAEPLGKCLTTLMSLHAAVHGDTELSAQSLPEPGMRLGDFVLEAQVGRGGMGVVYRAKQISLDRTVALKLLPNSHLLSPNQLRRFTLESRAAAQLQHDNIVPVYAVGSENKIHYFAMQLIEGCSLDKVDYRTWSGQNYATLLNAAVELADALAHAHESGVIHRDIKPGNLLLDEKGKVWITDFGLALCQSDGRLTMTGDLVGTMNYMSPEQALGQPLDERTDVFSLGATLYELITGKAAFPGQVRGEVLRAIEHAEPIAPRKLNPACPYDLETVVLKALAKNREDRYASAAQMRDELRRVARGEAIQSRRPSLLHRTWRLVQKHRTLAAVAGVGLLATCLSTTVGASIILLTRDQLRESQAESKNNLLLAEDNYWQGRNLVQRWNKDVVRKLADIPGAEALHTSMLADTIAYYQAFLEKAQSARGKTEGVTDHELAKDIAAARLGLASALDAIGQTQQSIDVYRQALVDLRALGHADPVVLSRTAIGENDLAVVLLRTGQVTSARQHLEAALQSLASSATVTTDLRAAIHLNMARVHRALGDSPAEQAALTQAEALYREALQTLNDARQVSAINSELGAVLDLQALVLAERDPKTAIGLCRRAIELHQSACSADAVPLEWRRRLAASEHNLGVLWLEQGDIDAARRTFEQAIATKLDIGKRSGLRPDSGADAATSYLALGRLESRQRRTARALECFEQAIAAVKHDRASQPTLENQLLLAESLGSHFRLSKDAAFRLECQGLLKGLDRSALSDPQLKIVDRLDSLLNASNSEDRPPVSPVQVSPGASDAQPSEPSSESK